MVPEFRLRQTLPWARGGRGSWGQTWDAEPDLVLSLPAGPGKSLTPSETPGLSHYLGTKKPPKGWRGEWSQEGCLGDDVPGHEAETWATALALSPRCWASSGKSLPLSGLSFPLYKLSQLDPT